MALTTRATDCGEQIVCSDCGRWCREGGAIVHSKRCDLNEQPATFAPSTKGERRDWRHVKAAARRGQVGSVLSDDEIVDAVVTGHLTVSDAMNRDD